ncbi:VacJ family lipoprotein [Azotobacter bryophylli]|uniref:VacJ family lipoprotein n=1 Tax=Azotobacter bryophylli TaxID=1986537 RepID=A0ABV7AX90_9GAMM
MARGALLVAALLCAPLVCSAAGTDPDGFKRPLEQLRFNPALGQREFERSSLATLNVYDPWESWNRRIYHFNYRFDEWVFLPVVRTYRRVTPRFVRSGIGNFFANLGDVSNLLNSVLQLKGKRSLDITARLLFNTIFGVGGLWDPASRMGLHRQSEDFGQTLGYYGVPGGPYLMLPILGPSNLRDAGGLVTDFFSAYQINYLDFAKTSSDQPELLILRGVDARYGADFRYGQLNSPFEYEQIRFVYSRARDLQIAE